MGDVLKNKLAELGIIDASEQADKFLTALAQVISSQSSSQSSSPPLPTPSPSSESPTNQSRLVLSDENVSEAHHKPMV